MQRRAALATGGIGTALGSHRVAFEQGKKTPRSCAGNGAPSPGARRSPPGNSTKAESHSRLITDNMVGHFLEIRKSWGSCTARPHRRQRANPQTKSAPTRCLSRQGEQRPIFHRRPGLHLRPCHPRREHIPIEDALAAEVTHFQGVASLPTSTRRHPAFGPSPAPGHRAIFTERGAPRSIAIFSRFLPRATSSALIHVDHVASKDNFAGSQYEFPLCVRKIGGVKRILMQAVSYRPGRLRAPRDLLSSGS